MNLKLKNPLIVFDLETTGTNIIRDRIVEISMLKLDPCGERVIRTERINPTIPIPQESSLIHGIYEKDVKDSPTFKDLSSSLAQFFKGADLAGFNLLRFDLPVLMEEFLRADVSIDFSKRKVIDAQKIFHMMEKRNLSAAYKFYCDKDLTNAHSAEADTIATFEVLDAQVERYEDEEVKDLLGNTLGIFENDFDKINSLFNSKMVDYTGRLTYNNKGDIVFNFGKFKDKKVTAVLEREPQYYDWIMNSEFSLDLKRKLTSIKLGMKSK